MLQGHRSQGESWDTTTLFECFALIWYVLATVGLLLGSAKGWFVFSSPGMRQRLFYLGCSWNSVVLASRDIGFAHEIIRVLKSWPPTAYGSLWNQRNIRGHGLEKHWFCTRIHEMYDIMVCSSNAFATNIKWISEATASKPMVLLKT